MKMVKHETSRTIHFPGIAKRNTDTNHTKNEMCNFITSECPCQVEWETKEFILFVLKLINCKTISQQFLLFKEIY